MYRYDAYDHALVQQRVDQFRDQTRRFLEGSLSEDDFRPLRLQNGLYIQKHAPMLRPHPGGIPGTHPLHDVLTLLRAQYMRRLEMTAGEAIIYHGGLLHASGPNATGEQRPAIGCVCVPREAELEHAIIISPTQVEVFSVSEKFFLEYVPGTRPASVTSLGIREFRVDQLTEADVLASPHLRRTVQTSQATS